MSSRTILIVETPGNDSGRYRELARRAGFSVATTNSGTMTKSVVQRTHPSLVLLTPHTNSPGPSEIARSLKEDPTVADVPVFMLVSNEHGQETAYPTEACATLDASDDELLGTMQLLAKTQRRIHVEPPRSAGPLEGNLEHDSLPDVLQFLFAARKSGRITIDDGTRRMGRIFIEGGKVVHAESGQLEGIAAFRQLSYASKGGFKFHPDIRTPQRTMLEDGLEMLLEAARRQDTEARDGHAPPPRSARGARTRQYARSTGSTLPSLTAHEDDTKKGKPFAGLLDRITRAFS